MSTTGSFDTGYVGAHRWHVDGPNGGYHWTCVCGDKGNVASKNVVFVQECFAGHAHRKLEEAAVDLVLEGLPHSRASYKRLMIQAEQAKEAGNTDRHNILMLAANHRYHESQEVLRQEFESLTWVGWPDDIEGPEGLAADTDKGGLSYWLHVSIGERGWAWETWLVDRLRGDEETRVSKGSAPTLPAAQRASWEALVRHQEELADQEQDPF